MSSSSQSPRYINLSSINHRKQPSQLLPPVVRSLGDEVAVDSAHLRCDEQEDGTYKYTYTLNLSQGDCGEFKSAERAKIQPAAPPPRKTEPELRWSSVSSATSKSPSTSQKSLKKLNQWKTTKFCPRKSTRESAHHRLSPGDTKNTENSTKDTGKSSTKSPSKSRAATFEVPFRKNLLKQRRRDSSKGLRSRSWRSETRLKEEYKDKAPEYESLSAQITYDTDVSRSTASSGTISSDSSSKSNTKSSATANVTDPYISLNITSESEASGRHVREHVFVTLYIFDETGRKQFFRRMLSDFVLWKKSVRRVIRIIAQQSSEEIRAYYDKMFFIAGNSEALADVNSWQKVPREKMSKPIRDLLDPSYMGDEIVLIADIIGVRSLIGA